MEQKPKSLLGQCWEEARPILLFAAVLYWIIHFVAWLTGKLKDKGLVQDYGEKGFPRTKAQCAVLAKQLGDNAIKKARSVYYHISQEETEKLDKEYEDILARVRRSGDLRTGMEAINAHMNIFEKELHDIRVEWITEAINLVYPESCKEKDILIKEAMEDLIELYFDKIAMVRYRNDESVKWRYREIFDTKLAQVSGYDIDSQDRGIDYPNISDIDHSHMREDPPIILIHMVDGSIIKRTGTSALKCLDELGTNFSKCVSLSPRRVHAEVENETE
jgi:hypothetical protein